MSLEALPTSNDFPNFLIYDTISASPANLFFPNNNTTNNNNNSVLSFSGEFASTQTSLDVKPGQQRRKRRRKPKSSKNKEEAENQRMTHIAVERNRRRQMNEHLSVLRSLMPDSYIQRGDQASIVGGAIDFVKELEQLLQSLEAQKRKSMQQQQQEQEQELQENKNKSELDLPPFSDFFTYPQYLRFHAPRDCYFPPPPPSPETHHRTPALADIEVTLIESHANLRILSPRRPRQLLKLVAGLQALSLTILHLNVTSLDFMVLYSLSTKVEEGCGLTTIEEIAAAVHHMLSLIEAVTPAHSQ